MGGFEHTASADVYKRWCAFAALVATAGSTAWSSYRVPWLFDEEAVDVLRFFTNLKCSLMPSTSSGGSGARSRHAGAPCDAFGVSRRSWL